jgi:hypothetical protein
MLSINGQYQDLVITAKKECPDSSVIYKIRFGKKRPVLVFESAQIAHVEAREVLIKLPRRQTYLEFESHVQDLINTTQLCSVEFHPKHGIVLKCKLKEDASDIEPGHNYNITLTMVSVCKKPNAPSIISWDISCAPTLLFDDKEENDDEEEDEDHGPTQEEIDLICEETISRLHIRIQSLTEEMNVSKVQLDAFNSFLKKLSEKASLELIQKATLLLESE